MRSGSILEIEHFSAVGAECVRAGCVSLGSVPVRRTLGAWCLWGLGKRIRLLNAYFTASRSGRRL